MPVIGDIVEGDWVYHRNQWYDPWQATHRPTGTNFDTGEVDRDFARAFVANLTTPDTATSATVTPDTPPVALTYTLAPGSRARAGHQRFTASHLATTDTEPATAADTPHRVEQ